MRVSPASLLSLVLRQQGQLSTGRQVGPLDVKAVAAELDAAPTVAEKLLILERLLRQDQALRPSPTQVDPMAHVSEEQAAPSWRISDKSAASLSELHHQHYGRQWEAEAVIKAVIEHVHQARADGAVGGVAMPFKPTAADMEKAIEALGYSPRSLLGHDQRLRHDETVDAGRGSGLLRAAAILLLGMLIGILLFAM